MEFTAEQKRVIDIRDKNVLVSAAAGSGKTAVIVERVTGLVIKDGLNISEMLIVTFTKAAAEEMRGRIRDAFELKLEGTDTDDPAYAHIERQLTLIFQAPIMTIDSFCLELIRNNFNICGIDPSFRVADEGELKMLRADVMDELMDRHYDGEAEEDFYSFLERFSVKKSDEDVTGSIEQLYDFADSRPDPEGFLEGITGQYRINDTNDLEKNSVILFMEELAKSKLKACIKALQKAIDTASEISGPSAYIPVLEDDLSMLAAIKDVTGFSGLKESFNTLSFKKLPSKKNEGEDPALREKAKNLRNSVKKSIDNINQRYFSASADEIAEEFRFSKKDAKMLSILTLEFMHDFKEAKAKKGIVDFSDIEHMALEILKNDEVRERYTSLFREIIIDEYQDSNRIQEEIFKSISNGRDYFCVGDVKQSIYSFRDACPELFTDKYERYGTDTVNEGELLLLSKNFRSRQSVLSSVNGVFKNIMSRDAGGVEYDEAAYLNFGGVYTRNISGDETEYILAGLGDDENVKDNEAEAIAVAERIKELVGSYDIEDKKTHAIRKCGYGDIVILMRALKGRGEDFMNILMQRGIPANVDSRSGYLLSDEIRDVINFLSCIDNPIQDIPLAGTLLSLFGGFDESELALIKASSPDENLYFALKQALTDKNTGEELKDKAGSFLLKLEAYRDMSSYISVYELISRIITDHKYDTCVRAMSEGSMRLDNLNMLLYRASEFEKTSFKGLFRFIRYIEYMKKYEVDFSGGAMAEGRDAVRIMSIHHSKGLEFPVVFVCGMHRQFNNSDLKGRLLVDDKLGAGMDIIDTGKRTRRRTLIKNVIADRKRLSAFGEELRVLYVAMTRAEQKLILTGVTKGEPLGEDEVRCAAKLPASPEEGSSYGALIDYALDADEGLDKIIKRRYVDIGSLILNEIGEQADKSFEKDDFFLKASLVSEERTEQLRKVITEKTNAESRRSSPDKLSVSFLKHEAMEEKGVEIEALNEERVSYVPGFISGSEFNPKSPVRGAIRGTAYHTVFERIDFIKASSKEGAGEFIKDLVHTGRLTGDEAKMIAPEDIAAFVNSPLGKRMYEAEKKGKLYKEQPFVILVPANEINSSYSPDETVMVQGIIDAYFEEDGRIIITDYKTDRVKTADELINRYKAQLDYYAKAIRQLTEKEVAEEILYSVTLGEIINI